MSWTGASLPPLDDDEWNAYVAEGDRLFALINNISEGTVSDRWQDFESSLAKWGYSFAQESQETPINMSEWDLGLHQCLKDINVKSDPDAWKRWTVSHGDIRQQERAPLKAQSYIAPDLSRRKPTGAVANILMNKGDEAVIIENLVTATEANQFNIGRQLWHANHPEHPDSKYRIPEIEQNELPDLERGGDIIWGLLKYGFDQKENIGIKYLMRYSLRDKLSCRTINKATPRPLEFWPGVDISTDTPGFRGILGSPIGMPLAEMLIEHKNLLTRRHITKCQIFLMESLKNSYSLQPCVIFHLN